MAFQKGVPRAPTAGRKKGTPNKSKILKVSDYLAIENINPVHEIMKLMPMLEERDRARLWMDLLSYCQAKPSTYIEDSNNESEDLIEEFKHVADEALILIAGGKKEIS